MTLRNAEDTQAGYFNSDLFLEELEDQGLILEAELGNSSDLVPTAAMTQGYELMGNHLRDVVRVLSNSSA
jgi:hypothetical protein